MGVMPCRNIMYSYLIWLIANPPKSKLISKFEFPCANFSASLALFFAKLLIRSNSIPSPDEIDHEKLYFQSRLAEMSGNEFRFFLSCDINLPVTFRVERLEGNLPPAKSSDSGAHF